MTSVSEAPAVYERIGHYYLADRPYEVSGEKIREYARAVQDYHPAHWDVSAAQELGFSGLVAPLTFTSIPAMAANRKLMEEVITGYETYVQTEQTFEQHRPIVAGDVLQADTELSGVRTVAGKDMITITNTFVDAAGEMVHTMHTTIVGVTSDEVEAGITDAVNTVMMHDVTMSGTADGEYVKTERVGEAPAASTAGAQRTPGSLNFDTLSVGDTIDARTVGLSRGDLVNYAGVSGDANPIHWDERIAKLAGLPDTIAHGMLTMGMGVAFASAWSGDPGAVSKYSVRLSSPAIVPETGNDDLEYSGRIKSLDSETRSGTMILFAKSAGKKIFGMATLDIRFA